MKKISKKQRLQKETKQLLVFGIIAALVFLAIVYGAFRTEKPTQPERNVTFYDRGIPHSILTRASTVRGALKVAHIDVDPHDR